MPAQELMAPHDGISGEIRKRGYYEAIESNQCRVAVNLSTDDITVVLVSRASLPPRDHRGWSQQGTFLHSERIPVRHFRGREMIGGPSRNNQGK